VIKAGAGKARYAAGRLLLPVCARPGLIPAVCARYRTGFVAGMAARAAQPRFLPARGNRGQTRIAAFRPEILPGYYNFGAWLPGRRGIDAQAALLYAPVRGRFIWFLLSGAGRQ